MVRYKSLDQVQPDFKWKGLTAEEIITDLYDTWNFYTFYVPLQHEKNYNAYREYSREIFQKLDGEYKHYTRINNKWIDKRYKEYKEQITKDIPYFKSIKLTEDNYKDYYKDTERLVLQGRKMYDELREYGRILTDYYLKRPGEGVPSFLDLVNEKYPID